MGKKIVEALSAAAGAVLSFFCTLPPVVYILIGVMSVDFVTGLICGALGKSEKTETGGLSSRTAFKGLLKKVLILLIVLLAFMIDLAIASTAGIEFSAIMWAVCLWFIASEGMSVVENVSLAGVPVPKIIKQALDILKKKGEGTPEQDECKTEE